MKRTQVRRALLSVAGGVAVLVLAAGCGGNDKGGMDHGKGSNSTQTGGSTGTFNDADVSFAQNMIPHHQQAVEMATLAETKATNPQIKKLAADIKGAQQPEIDLMTGWLKAWGKPVTPAGGHGGHAMPGMMSEPEMTTLKSASGADFDRQFARMMIAHHNGAIDMAREVQAKGCDPQVRKLAVDIEKTQSAEVATLQKLLDQL
jgi:uncharacterized protein (DUF305 family)